MLVLSRKAEQTIHIGGLITVTVLRVKGRTVKIGIQAPLGTEVLRGELLDHSPDPTPQEPDLPSAPSSGTGLSALPAVRPSARRRSPDLVAPSTAGLPRHRRPAVGPNSGRHSLRPAKADRPLVLFGR